MIEEIEEGETARRFRVQFDFRLKWKGKEMDGKSMTEPDMNLTVAQLLERHTRGIGAEVKTHEPLYFETEVPTVRDITDVHEYREFLEQKLEQTKQFIQNEQRKDSAGIDQGTIQPTDKGADIRTDEPKD